MMAYVVVYHPEAEAEWMDLPRAEQVAIDAARRKLEIEGPRLPYPHQSKVKGSKSLRELRPRAGRSIWRPLYTQVSAETFLIAAIAPEAKKEKRGFVRAVRLAERRIGEVI